MPLDFLADFRAASNNPADDFWSTLAVGYAASLVELEPRIRFRIRNLPSGGVLRSTPRNAVEPSAELMTKMNEMGAKTSDVAMAIARASVPNALQPPKQKNVIKSPGSLYRGDVPAILRNRIEIPAAKKFWVGLYHCKTCNKKVYEIDIQKKKHEGHDYTRERIIKKGVKSTWDTNFRLCMGPGNRIIGNALPSPSIALTALPTDPGYLRRQGDREGLMGNGYHWILLLPFWLGDFDKEGRPVKKPFDIAAEKKRLEDELEDCEKVVVLPSKPREVVPALLQFLKELDPDLLDPIDDKKTAQGADEKELFKQLEADGLYKADGNG